MGGGVRTFNVDDLPSGTGSHCSENMRISAVKRETPVTPPPPSPAKPSLTEDEVSKKSTAIIEEYIHIYDIKVDERAASLASPPARLQASPPPCPNRRRSSASRS